MTISFTNSRRSRSTYSLPASSPRSHFGHHHYHHQPLNHWRLMRRGWSLRQTLYWADVVLVKRDEDRLGRSQRRRLRRVNVLDWMIAKHQLPNPNQVVQKAIGSRRESEVRECLRLGGSLETLNLLIEGDFLILFLKMA